MNDLALKRLSQKLGIDFKNLKFLGAALTHRSLGITHNERLEFLGDAILNFTIAESLFQRFPNAREGELTRMRAQLVRGETLAEIARTFDLGEYLQIGESEFKTGGHLRESILADTLEAIIAAIYLDAGLKECMRCILSWYEDRLAMVGPDTSVKDPKTRLQEYMQAKHLPLPEYEVLNMQGSAHNPLFEVQCKVAVLEKPYIGVANNRRKAEQLAAEAALKALNEWS